MRIESANEIGSNINNIVKIFHFIRDTGIFPFCILGLTKPMIKTIFQKNSISSPYTS